MFDRKVASLSAALVVGFALVLTYNGPGGSYWMGGAADGAALPLPFAYRIGQALSFAVIAAFSGRLYPLSDRATGVASASVACLVASAAVGLAPSLGFSDLPVFAVVGPGLTACVGAFSSALYLAWFEVVCRLKVSVVFGCFAAAYLASGLMAFGLLLVAPPGGAMVLAVLLPAVSLPLYLTCIAKLGDAVPYEGEKARSGWSFPFRPVVLMAMVAFANSLIGATLPEGEPTLSPLGAIGVGALVLLVVAWKGPSLDTRWLFQISLPLIIAAALGAMLGGRFSSPASTLLSNAAFVCFIVFVSVTLCGMVFRYGINPLWLMGCVFAARTGASCLAAGVDALWAQELLSGQGRQLVMAALILVLSALYPVSYTFHDAYSSWGVHLTQLGRERVEEPFEGLYGACMVASRMNGMTRREEEILFYLAQGMTLPAIGERLCLSTATVKTHTQHVYKKMGVHSKAELMERIAQ